MLKIIQYIVAGLGCCYVLMFCAVTAANITGVLEAIELPRMEPHSMILFGLVLIGFACIIKSKTKP